MLEPCDIYLKELIHVALEHKRMRASTQGQRVMVVGKQGASQRRDRDFSRLGNNHVTVQLQRSLKHFSCASIQPPPLYFNSIVALHSTLLRDKGCYLRRALVILTRKSYIIDSGGGGLVRA